MKRKLLSCSLLLLVLAAGCAAESPPAFPTSTPTTRQGAATVETNSVDDLQTAIPSATPGPSGELRLWLAWDVRELSGLEQVLARFTRLYPDIRIQIAYYQNAELLAKLRQGTDPGQAPDLLIGPSSWGVGLWQDGLIAEVSDWITPEFHARVHPLAWKQVEYQDFTIGLPLELEGMLLYRNSQLVPEPAVTVEEMVASAQALQLEQKAAGTAFDLGFRHSAPLLAGCGGSFLLPSGSLGFDEQIGGCWLQMLRLLRQAGPVVFNSEDDFNLFVDQQAAWMIDSSARAEEIASRIGAQNLVIDPWPRYAISNGVLTGYSWTENLYLTRQITQKNLPAAKIFALYLLSSEAQAIMAAAEHGAHLPALMGVEAGTPAYQRALFALDQNRPLPLNADLAPIAEIVDKALARSVVGRGDPQVAIQVVINNVTRILNRQTSP